MALLHSLRPAAVDHAITLLARAQGYDRTQHADDHGTSFDLSQVLDVWSPSWREGPPPAGMGANSRMLRAFTYCVFVGVWVEEVGFLLHHPDAVSPHGVYLSFLTKDDATQGPRALLTVQSATTRTFVSFPPLPSALLPAASSRRFVDSHAALRELMAGMVERVNLVTPAALLLPSDEFSADES